MHISRLEIIPAASFPSLNMKVVAPHPSISDCVQCIWLIRSKSDSPDIFREKLYPDAGSSLTFSISSIGVSVGLFHNTKVIFQQWNMRNSYLSIRFKPGGAYRLLGLDVNEFTDNEIQIGNELSKRFLQITPLMDCLPSLNENKQVHLVTNWLLQKRLKAKASNEKMQALFAKALCQLIPPQILAEDHGIGRRTLERYTRNQFGVTPNQLHSFSQIKKARDKLVYTQNDLATIALDCGYFDQSHFANSFRESTLETPLNYRIRKLSQISN